LRIRLKGDAVRTYVYMMQDSFFVIRQDISMKKSQLQVLPSPTKFSSAHRVTMTGTLSFVGVQAAFILSPPQSS